MNNNNFALQLKEIRAQLKIPQSSLAKMLGVTIGTVGMWESGKRIPHANELIRIADYLNVSVDFLLGRENKEMIKRTEQRPAIAKQEQEYLDALNALNAIGKIKALAYIQGLQTSKEFTD